MFAIVFWILEGTFSVIRCAEIIKPQRDIKDYEIGEEVTGKFGKKNYPAKIIRKGENHNTLTVVLKGIIARQRLQSLKDIEGGDSEEQDQSSTSSTEKGDREEHGKRAQTTKQTKRPSTSATEKAGSHKKQKEEALREKKLKLNEAREEKLEREKVMKQSKEKLVNLLDDQLLAAEADCYSLSSSDSSRSSSPMSESLLINSKGHPFVANKAPRCQFSEFTSLSPSCPKCLKLEEENQGLHQRIEELTSIQSQSSSPQAEVHSSYSRPVAGVYEDEEFTLKNGMSELFPATGVYLHKDQLRTALNKSLPSTSARTETAGKKRDGKKVCRYLLSVFFSKMQLEESSLTASPLSKYKPLNELIINAITGKYLYCGK